tara:strand:+ start:191 stop:346 length:156 start_codon:yes stop_codon:yes gene_type:complete
MTLGAKFQPLYKQIYALLAQRLVDADWKLLGFVPSERALANELDVSQGDSP